MQAALGPERLSLIKSQIKHMFPSRPPSHLPLGSERTSARFLAGSADRRPSAPEAPARINTAGLCLPRWDQPGRPCARPGSQALDPQGRSPPRPGHTRRPRSSSVPGKWEEKPGKGKLTAGPRPPSTSLPQSPPCWARGHCPLPPALPSLPPTSSHLPP